MTRQKSSESNPLAELAALVQLGTMSQAPQLEQQRMQQTAQDRSMAAALNVLGLQQQSEQAQAIEAFRQAQLGENARQFDVGSAQAATQQEAVGQRFAQDFGLREQEVAQRDNDLGFRREQAASAVTDQALQRDLQERELAQRAQLGQTGNIADIVRVLINDPTSSPTLRSGAMSAVDPRLAAVLKAESDRDRAQKEGVFSGQLSAVGDDQKLREQLFSVMPPEIATDFRARDSAAKAKRDVEGRRQLQEYEASGQGQRNAEKFTNPFWFLTR